MNRSQKYQRTKKGLVAKIYARQRSSSKSRGHRMPEYNLDELRDWCYSQKKFHELYSEWVNSGYEKRLIPSVDRKHDDIHYCFSNIQIMTWDENNRKTHIPGGSHYRSKSVDQFSIDGEYLATYASARIASEVVGLKDKTSITRVCKGKAKQSAGYIWKYAKKDKK